MSWPCEKCLPAHPEILLNQRIPAIWKRNVSVFFCLVELKICFRGADRVRKIKIELSAKDWILSTGDLSKELKK